MKQYLQRYNVSHALVIGINAYQSAPRLGYARADADAIAQVLIDRCGFSQDRVIRLNDEQATGDAIRRAFLGLAGGATDRDDRVVFFFAGHGTTRSGRRGEVGYLVPVDGKADDVSSLIRWDEFTRNADLIEAKHLLFVMDACYGGLAAMRPVRSPGSMRFLKDMMQRHSRQVLTAGKADEVVSDSGGPRAGHSVFTGHLLEALEGGVVGGDGIVTATDVMAYVYDRVSKDNYSKQTPHCGHIDGDGDLIFMAPLLDEKPSADGVIGSDTLVAAPSIAIPTNTWLQSDLANEVKELVADHGKRIRLDDLVTEHLRVALGRLDPAGFSMNDPTTAEAITERLERYEAAVDNLATICVLLGRWGSAENKALLSRIFSRLADLNGMAGGLKIYVGMRWYPLTLLHYYAGIAALANDNIVTLQPVLRTLGSGADGDALEERVILCRANSGMAEAVPAFKLLPGRERQYTPLSELLFVKLQPLIEDLAFLGSSYETHFDRFEILNALNHADTRDPNRHMWGPSGRFAWKVNHSIGGGPFGELKREVDREGKAWKYLRVGMFGGEIDRASQVVAGITEHIGRLKWF
jgi:hypothetical protein